MDRYEVCLYPKVYKEIDELYTYIAVVKHNVTDALKILYKIKKALNSLEYFPEMHQNRLVGKYAKSGYKQIVIENYIAIYKIDKNSKKVFVVTIQYIKRKIKKIIRDKL